MLWLIDDGYWLMVSDFFVVDGQYWLMVDGVIN